MKKTVKTACIIALLLTMTMSECRADFEDLIIDQSQHRYEVLYGHDGPIGQTFTAGMDGWLVGISLVIKQASSAGGPIGSDIQITLHQVSSDNVVAGEVLASAYHPIEGIPLTWPGWVEIMFDHPYQQSEGQTLAFVVQDLSGGFQYGCNVYGIHSENLYSGGRIFVDNIEGMPLADTPIKTYDMTFYTLVVPEPAALSLLLIGTIAIKRSKDNQRTKTGFRTFSKGPFRSKPPQEAR